VQAGHVPQSAGQLAHDSEAAQTPSPHFAGPDEVLVHVHIDHAPFVHVSVPCPVGQLHICVWPSLHAFWKPPPLPVELELAAPLAQPVKVVVPTPKPSASTSEAYFKVLTMRS
jgi:hypothetical protein